MHDFEEITLAYDITPKLQRRLPGGPESLCVVKENGDDLLIRTANQNSSLETTHAPEEEQPINGNNIYPRLDDHAQDQGVDDVEMVSLCSDS